VSRAREADETELVYRVDGTDRLNVGLRRRPVVIGVVAGVLLLGVVLGLVIAGGGGDDGKAAPEPSAATAKAPPKEPAPAVAVAAPDAAPVEPETEPAAEPAPEPAAEPAPEPAAEPAPPRPPKASGACAITFTSTPSGATVSVGRKKLGKTPLTTELPCKRTSATFSRPRYQDEVKAFTPKKGTSKVSVRLDRPSFTVKITSQPSGATVAVGGKKIGKTPVVAKVPGFQATTIKVSKPGYQAKSTKVTAKKNGTTLKVSLRRGN
jgi:hypothetical protein